MGETPRCPHCGQVIVAGDRHGEERPTATGAEIVCTLKMLVQMPAHAVRLDGIEDRNVDQ